MTTATASKRQRATRQLEEPAGGPAGGSASPCPGQPAPGSGRPAARQVLTEQEEALMEFADYLRTITNRDGWPYEDATIDAYIYPVKHLDKWMTASGINGDFTAADTATLNRYFRDYYQQRGQGGTHTTQRNLIQLFNYLERERGNASPYGRGLNRYAEVKHRPVTLSTEFVDDLLEVTGGGKARDFETARDHAMIRILRTEGIRREELLGMIMYTLPRTSSGTRCSAWFP
jgi:site-specific recombinase XerD